MDIAFLFKKLLTLTALVDPFLAVPLFLAATGGMPPAARARFARQLGMTVGMGLLGGGVIGMHVLSVMGVSLAAMQFAGGTIAMLVALAMVLAKEETVKMSAGEKTSAGTAASLVPLGIPLLVGPAALSYVMATSSFTRAWDLVTIVLPPVLIGLLTWVVFEMAARTQRLFSPNALSVLERVGGFLLAAIAVEMMATGLKGMFPLLAH
jgi:multiple antibiotic resistance protein